MELAIYEFCRDYCKNPRRGRRLLLYGGNGCGKTHCAKAIHWYARKIAMQIPFDPVTFGDQEVQLATAAFLFWPGIVDGFKRGAWDAIDDAMIQSLLVIDDVGAEHDPSGVGKEKLYTILERREYRWTVITTNCPPQSWEAKFERRIQSRLYRNFTHLNMMSVPDFATV